MTVSVFKVLFAFVFLSVLTSCGKVQQPQFQRLENFGIRHLNLQEATVGMDIRFYNPNDFGLTVKEADIDVYVDTTYLGKFVQTQNVGVNATSDFAIPMEGKLSLQQAIKSKLHQQAGKEVELRATGGIKVGKGGVFINKDINYSEKHKLDLDLLKNPAGAGFFR